MLKRHNLKITVGFHDEDFSLFGLNESIKQSYLSIMNKTKINIKQLPILQKCIYCDVNTRNLLHREKEAMISLFFRKETIYHKISLLQNQENYIMNIISLDRRNQNNIEIENRQNLVNLIFDIMQKAIEEETKFIEKIHSILDKYKDDNIFVSYGVHVTSEMLPRQKDDLIMILFSPNPLCTSFKYTTLLESHNFRFLEIHHNKLSYHYKKIKNEILQLVEQFEKNVFLYKKDIMEARKKIL